MKNGTTTPDGRRRGRMSADDRRRQVLLAARAEFAATGLHGTSTEAIAARAGVSQPYLFRLFGTKRKLFIECVEHGFDHVLAVFEQAAEGADASARLDAMGSAYVEMLADRQELLAQMQAYAACGDPEIQALVRRRFGELWEQVARLSGAGAEDLRAFFAAGMLLNVAAAMDLPAIAAEHGWARALLELAP